MKRYIVFALLLVIPLIGYSQKTFDQQQMSSTIYQPQYKNPGVAGVLSIVMPGLGQMYNDQMSRGFAYCFSFYGCTFSSVACYYLSDYSRRYDYSWGVILFAAGAVITHIWAFFDAVVTADRLNRQHGFVASASPTLLIGNDLALGNSKVVAPGFSLNISF